MPSQMHIGLFEDFRITYDGELVTSVNTARLQSLLAYLLLHRDAPQPRQHIAFRLWPDSTESQARTNLRQLLHHLRRALPDADQFLWSDTQSLQWRPDPPYTLDVAEFEAAAAEGLRGEEAERRRALTEAVKLYRGRLLPSCYDEWIEPERERLQQLYAGVLQRQLGLLEEARDYQAAIRAAQRLLHQDDLREVTYRDLMRLHALAGDRASALRVYHECATVLERELGVRPGPATREVYERLLAAEPEAAARDENDVIDGSPDVPLVGRQEEWSKLQAAWRSARRGRAQLLVISGEAGIGKTRLAEELLAWAARQGLYTARARCYAAEGRLAYAPVTEWLKTEPFREALSRLEPIWLTELARILPEVLVSHPELPRPRPLSESWQRQRLFQALTRAVLRPNGPLLLLIDDLQWSDAETLEWLQYVLRSNASAPLLVVGTVRTEEVSAEHPLKRLQLELRGRGQASTIELVPLDASETAELAEHVAGRDVGGRQVDVLYRETEGNPLFVVESVRAGLEDQAGEKSGVDSLPPRVQAVIERRLAQLSPLAREIAELASAIGRAFAYDVLRLTTEASDEELVGALEELWQRRVVHAHGEEEYDFSHDKLREVAYSGISPARRRLLHRRIAQGLETLHGDDLDGVSGQLASHYERAGMIREAIPHLQRAAEVARRVYANEDALEYLHRTLRLLDTFPEGQWRDGYELSARVSMGPALMATRGYAAQEVGQTYERARTLCERMGRMKELPRVLWGLWTYHVVRAELEASRELAEQFLNLAREQDDEALLVASHFCLGASLFHLGVLEEAGMHLEQATDRYDPTQHRRHVRAFGPDPGIFCPAYRAHVLWHLGYPDRAVEVSRAALDRARQLSDPFSLVIALDYAAMLHQFRREPEAVRSCAISAVQIGSEHGFSYYKAWATIMQGWAETHLDDISRGIDRMMEGLESLRATGAGLRRPYYLGLLAGARRRAGRVDAALSALEEAEHELRGSAEWWCEPEIQRLRGELLLEEDSDVEMAQSCFRQALEAARRQGNRAHELRAATSLYRLSQVEDARGIPSVRLETVYEQFSEGTDTPDLQEAVALLTASS